MLRGGLLSAFPLLLSLVACNGAPGNLPQSAPPPSRKIEHVVILLQENRSFNTLFMGFPGAETSTSGQCKITKWAHWCSGQTVRLKPVTLESTGPPVGVDIGHEHQDFEVECDRDATHNCRMDGFDLIRKGAIGNGSYAELYPYAYVERKEAKPYWDLARRYALADRMFFTDTAASFIAHQQIIAGTARLSAQRSLTDQPDDAVWGCDAFPGTQTPVLLRDGRELRPTGGSHLPFPCFTEYSTMADLLDAAKVSWTYYVAPMVGSAADFSGFAWNGFDAIKKVRYGPDWKNHISKPNTRFFGDIKHGSLPSVSWVIPTMADSDHPGSGCNTGPRWITRVVNAIGTSPYWGSTVIVILWDDWGGWYDNVAPPKLSYTSLGFRVPMIVVSPYAKPGYVSHTQYEFGSVLQFVEREFGLGSLGTTDATANGIDDVFDFSQSPTQFKPAPLPRGLKACEQEPQGRPSLEKDIDPG